MGQQIITLLGSQARRRSVLIVSKMRSGKEAMVFGPV